MWEHDERHNPLLNAFCLVAADAALQKKHRREALWQVERHDGEPRGLLDGLPTPSRI